jgi:nifR3 family TIM-barrel protein
MAKIAHIDLGKDPLLLAPMEDVSDPPFRRLCKKHGADMLYTEFISSDGLIRDAEKSTKKLDIYEDERPVGIQIFGGEEEAMSLSAKIVERAKPELLDINYGCPVKNVVCKNAGSGILRDIDKMVRLTEIIVKSTNLPVTVKTRLGWDANSIRVVEVAERLQDVGIKAISIHCRTKHQMYTGKADWTWLAKVKENPRLHIPVFGNGDVTTPEDAKRMLNDFGADGVMIGRASIGHPWIFREVRHYLNTGEHLAQPTLAERLDACREHVMHSIEWKGHNLGLLEMRRHYGPYFKGLENIKPFRSRLVLSMSVQEIFDILGEIELHYKDQENIYAKPNTKTEYAGFDA